MLRTAPEAKKAAVRGYGGIITECEPSTSSREAVFAEVHERTGADFVHPYNDPRVIAGQGTCSKAYVPSRRAGRGCRPNWRRRNDFRMLPDFVKYCA